MIKFSYKTGVFFLLIIISSWSCGNEDKPALAASEAEVLPDDIVELRADQIKLAGVELGAIEMHSLGNILKVNGTVSVAPQNQATVSMPLGGFIKNTSLFPGNAVNKGQTLAVIENQDFVDIQQNYLEAKNRLQFAEADLKRHTDLFKQEVYSEQNFQQVTMEYKNLKALVRSLGQKLILIGIRPDQLSEDNISSTVNLVSPIKGFLKSVNVNIGKYVSPTDVLFEIVDNEKLFIELILFEKDADKVSTGQKVKFFINNETEEHEAVITQTGRSVSNNKTILVYGNVVSSCRNILPGMYVNAYIDESENQVTALPSDAIVSFDDKDYIFCFEKEKMESGKPFTEYRMIEIRKGVSSPEFTEIKVPGGLNISTARIVIKGAYTILSAKKNAGEMAC
jgi:cobalt-zinc-cadmium efflux system membrane fusion protein